MPSNEAYVPGAPTLGTPTRCSRPAPAARCDQPVKPGQVIPAPLTRHQPAARRSVARHTSTGQRSFAATWVRHRPVQWATTHPCVYTPSISTTIYDVQMAKSAPDGVVYLLRLDSCRSRRMEGDAGTNRLSARSGTGDSRWSRSATVRSHHRRAWRRSRCLGSGIAVLLWPQSSCR